MIILIIIHFKYFPAVVDQIWNESLLYWTNDVKSAARCRLLNQWRQNDVKSAAHCRLWNVEKTWEYL